MSAKKKSETTNPSRSDAPTCSASFVPFSEPWAKEVMKLPKSAIVEMLRRSLMRMRDVSEKLATHIEIGNRYPDNPASFPTRDQLKMLVKILDGISPPNADVLAPAGGKTPTPKQND